MRTIVLTGALIVGAACGGAAIDTYLHAAPAAIEIDSADRLPAGTELLVGLRQPLGARVNGVGDRIAVDVLQAVATREGEVVVPIGATIHGTVTAVARPATRGNQVAIALRFDELMHNGRPLPLAAEMTRIAPAPVWDEDRGVRSPAPDGVGELLAPDEAVSRTGIQAGGPNGDVIGLGMGEAEPLLHGGTRMTLKIHRPTALGPSSTAPTVREAEATDVVVKRPQQPVAPGIGACGDDSVPAACYW